MLWNSRHKPTPTFKSLFTPEPLIKPVDTQYGLYSGDDFPLYKYGGNPKYDMPSYAKHETSVEDDKLFNQDYLDNKVFSSAPTDSTENAIPDKTEKPDIWGNGYSGYTTNADGSRLKVDANYQRLFNAIGGGGKIVDNFEEFKPGSNSVANFSSLNNVDNNWSDLANTDMGTQATMDYIAGVESGNGKYRVNPSSSARGMYQFITSTGKDVHNQIAKEDPVFADMYGEYDHKRTETDDEYSNILMKKLLANNNSVLKKNGYTASPVNAYALHLLGTSGGIKALNYATGKSKVLDENVRQNLLNNGFNPDDLIDSIGSKLNRKRGEK